jgi:hypothetical protein
MSKIKIELTPYEALSILSFLEEFKEDFEQRTECEALRNCITSFRDQVYAKISMSDMDDVIAENEVMKLVGKAPSNAPNDLI